MDRAEFYLVICIVVFPCSCWKNVYNKNHVGLIPRTPVNPLFLNSSRPFQQEEIYNQITGAIHRGKTRDKWANKHRRKRNKQRRIKNNNTQNHGLGSKAKMKTINKNKIFSTLPDRLVNIIRRTSADRRSGRLLNNLGGLPNSRVPSTYRGPKGANRNIYKSLTNRDPNDVGSYKNSQSSNRLIEQLGNLADSLLPQQDNQRNELAGISNKDKRQNDIDKKYIATLPKRILNLVRSSGALELSKMILDQVTKLLATVLNPTSKGTLLDANSKKHDYDIIESNMKQTNNGENCQCPSCPNESYFNDEPDWDNHPSQSLDKANKIPVVEKSTQALAIHEQIANLSIIDGMVTLYDQPYQRGGNLMYQPEEFDQYLNLGVVKWNDRISSICTTLVRGVWMFFEDDFTQRKYPSSAVAWLYSGGKAKSCFNVGIRLDNKISSIIYHKSNTQLVDDALHVFCGPGFVKPYCISSDYSQDEPTSFMVEGTKFWTLWEKWNMKGACECIGPADPKKGIPGMYPDKSRLKVFKDKKVAKSTVGCECEIKTKPWNYGSNNNYGYYEDGNVFIPKK